MNMKFKITFHFFDMPKWTKHINIVCENNGYHVQIDAPRVESLFSSNSHLLLNRTNARLFTNCKLRIAVNPASGQ